MEALASHSIRCGDEWIDNTCGHQSLLASAAKSSPLQRKKYYNGIGSEKKIAWLQRLETGAFGCGVSEQIQEVYKVGSTSPNTCPLTLVFRIVV